MNVKVPCWSQRRKLGLHPGLQRGRRGHCAPPARHRCSTGVAGRAGGGSGPGPGCLCSSDLDLPPAAQPWACRAAAVLASPGPVSGRTPLRSQGSLSNRRCQTGQAVVSLSLGPSRQGSGETTVQRSRAVRALGTRAGGLAPAGGGAWGPIGPEETPSSFLSIYFKSRVTGKQGSICWVTPQTATTARAGPGQSKGLPRVPQAGAGAQGPAPSPALPGAAPEPVLTWGTVARPLNSHGKAKTSRAGLPAPALPG